jgi:UDP-glucose 4-epimerase
MKILVTGGAGFIGSNLNIKLHSRGHHVKVLDNLSNGTVENIDTSSVEFFKGDILDRSLLEDLTSDVDSVVHLAALGSVPRSIDDPESSLEVNFKGTLNVLEAVRKTNAQFIFSSSSSVYGESRVLPRIESVAAEPRSPYAVSKLAAESLVSAYQLSYGIPTLSLRFFNVYGPRQSFGHPYAAAIPIFFESILKNVPLKVFGDGNQVRDFTYVDYVTDVILSAIEDRIYNPKPVNLGSSKEISINNLISLICKVTDSSPFVTYLPERNGDVRNSYANIDLLKQMFPSLKPISLESGIEETFNWYKNNINTGKTT